MAIQEMAYYKFQVTISVTGVLIKIVSGLLEIFSHFLLDGHHHSIKHDLARSCFQFWPKIGDEGDKISRKKALAKTVFSRNFVTLGADFEGRN